jgi:putative FmdB family regulatory protein
MPLYEYACESCHHSCELLIRSESERPECPHCGSHALAKQWSVPAAPGVRGGELPISGMSGGCGRPQCGTGGCQGLG